jgi:hypothetical protein
MILFHQTGVFLRKRIMSCFGCCEEDDVRKAADSGGPYVVKSSAGNLVGQARAVAS